MEVLYTYNDEDTGKRKARLFKDVNPQSLRITGMHTIFGYKAHQADVCIRHEPGAILFFNKNEIKGAMTQFIFDDNGVGISKR